jgi:rod shape-determining protein MreB
MFNFPNFNLSKKVAIDLGTANSLVYVGGQGVLLNEPTVVAITTDDNKVVAVGTEAKEMLGRTPINIQASRPMRDGVIADYQVTEAMLEYFLGKVCGRSRIFKPDVMISTPVGVTSVESRAVLDAAISAGAKEAYLIPEPLAAAIGAQIPISEASGNMVVNIGGGTAEVAVICLGGLVVSNSARVAGNKIDEAIANHLRRTYNLIVGDRTAEMIKIQIGSALPLDDNPTLEVKGRDAIAGLPRTVELTSHEVTEAVQQPLKGIVGAIKNVLEQTPPELSSDVIDKGMVLTGGTSLLRNIGTFLTQSTGVPAHVAEEPILCVVYGVGAAIENLEAFKKSVRKR